MYLRLLNLVPELGISMPLIHINFQVAIQNLYGLKNSCSSEGRRGMSKMSPVH